MKKDIETIITDLRNFIPQEGNSVELYDLLDELNETENPALAIPAMFELVEKYPDADLGTPGALVHSIEKIGNYENLLIQSVRKVPTYLNIWMVNRTLNSDIPDEKRKQLIELLITVSESSNVSVSAKQSAENFLKYQADKIIN